MTAGPSSSYVFIQSVNIPISLNFHPKPMQNPQLKQLQTALEAFSAIKLAIVFGSVAADKNTFDSDLDIAVLQARPMTAPQKMQIIEKLTQVFGCPIDLIDLKTVGEPLLGQILQHGNQVVGNKMDYAKLITQHVFNVEDFVPYQHRIYQERQRALKASLKA